MGNPCCGAVLLALAVSLMVGASVGARQSPAPAPSADVRFDAATIRPSPSNSEFGDTAVWQFMPHGDVTFSNAPLRLVIALAYGVELRFQDSLLIGSSDLLKQRFDIRGKAPERAQRAEGQAMLRALLEDRFALRTHVETREIPIYALTRVRPDRLGQGLRPSDIDCSRIDLRTEPQDSTPRRLCLGNRRDSESMRLNESGALSVLIWRVQQHLERPVRNATDLDGLFQWDLTFRVDRNPAADSPFPPLETAIQEQLGLRLVPRTGPWEVRVIDSVRPPTEN